MTRCGGGFCVPYVVEGQALRAVVDTGSPFLLVDGACKTGRWGCFADERDSVSLGDTSSEGFAGMDVQVDWRRGDWSIGGDGLGSGFRFRPVTFGVVRSAQGSGGTQAIYLGLVKDRQPRVRPTLLEQTDIRTLQFDFPRQLLTLSRGARLSAREDAIPLVDLRPLGALVSSYAFRVHSLFVNGERVALERPCVAIVDTGTTGFVISDTLYDSDELPMPGASVRDVRVDGLTERGAIFTLAASRRRPKNPEAEDFPLIVTPVTIPWFESGYKYSEFAVRRARAAKQDAAKQARGGATGAEVPEAEEAVSKDAAAIARDSLGSSRGLMSSRGPPHVLLLGLAFLQERRLIIDADERRMVLDP